MKAAEALALMEDRLRRFVRSKGKGALRFETEDDLVQGVAAKLLQAAQNFEWKGEEACWSFVMTVGERYMLDRLDFWNALKRSSSRVVELTHGPERTETGFEALLPPTTITGPGTAAARNEAIETLTRALAALPPRDRELVQHFAEGRSLDEQAQLLKIEYAALQKASRRALERLRKVYRGLSGP